MNKEEFEKHVENLNLKIPTGLKYDMSNVILKKYKPFGVSKDYPFMPVFKKPVEVCRLSDKGLYRVIPRYPDMAISENGKLFSMVNSKIETKFSKHYIYRIVLVRPTLNKTIHRTTLHKLIALAWCENDDYVKNNIVDHKDDDKTNNTASNLRWISNSKNVSKTANGTDFRWLVKNMRTGVISRYTSFTGVGRFLDMDKTMFSAERCPFVIKKHTGGYIVEDRNNFKGWLLEDKYNVHGVKYRYIIDNIKYTDLSSISKAFGKRLSSNTSVSDYLHTIGKELKLIGKSACGSIYAKNVDTEEELKFNNIAETAKYFNVTDSPIRFRLIGYRTGRLLNGGWLLRKCNTAYPIPKKVYKQIPSNVSVSKDGVVKVFGSLREAGNYLGKDKKTVRVYAESNSTLNGYKLKLVSLAINK